jgi:hypothetical protein
MMQRVLSNEQIKEFRHDVFVEDQVRDFAVLVGMPSGVVVDVGGGCGFFAERVSAMTGARVRVVDTDAASVESCRSKGVEACLGDALNPVFQGDEGMATFNLILHHLVGRTEEVTRQLQRQALAVWHSKVPRIFVNEYIYESYIPRFSGWLIFQVTKSGFLSALGRAVAALVPSLRANTFGVGVRFRSHEEWCEIFSLAGYDVERVAIGKSEPIALARRLLLIREIRRDSFLLIPRSAPDENAS